MNPQFSHVLKQLKYGWNVLGSIKHKMNPYV